METTQERLFKLEMRLAAIEYLVANMYAVAIAQVPDAERRMKAANEALRANLRGQVVPGVDAAWSDHIMAEMQDAMERVLVMMEEMVANLAKAQASGAAKAATSVPLATHRGSAMSAMRTAWLRLSS